MPDREILGKIVDQVKEWRQHVEVFVRIEKLELNTTIKTSPNLRTPFFRHYT